MLTINNLPPDIIYEVTKNLNLKDICNFMGTCNNLYNNIKNYEIFIFHNELKRENKLYNINNIRVTEHFFYNFLNYNIIVHLYRYRKRYYNKKNNNKISLRNFILYNEMQIDTIENVYLNNLFQKIFYFYVFNNFCHLSLYPNKFELCALYNFLQIEVFSISENFNYWFDFLESFKLSYRNVKIKYYNSMLDLVHTSVVIFSFDQLYEMSKYVTSIYIVKKIIGYKTLDLEKTHFNMCCFMCNEEYLLEICNLKMLFYKDDLISHNYNELKKLLFRENENYYNLLIHTETSLINNKIYIKNPITNRRMKLDGSIYNKLMKLFTENDYDYLKYYIRILSYIKKRQKTLRIRFFS